MKNQMKIKSLGLAVLLFISGSTLLAQSQTEKFKVSGNCGMCETRIEKAANGVDGVTSADWDKETKMLEVTLNTTKTDLHKIHAAVAGVGHDTDMHKAKVEVYNALPGCCKYERMTEKAANCCSDSSKECAEKENHNSTNHSH